MPAKTNRERLLAQLNAELQEAHASVQVVQRERMTRVGAEFNAAQIERIKGGSITIAPDEVESQLRERIAHLEQIKRIFATSPEIMPLIDSVIKQRIRAMVRHQVVFSTASNCFFLIAGWLLSLVNTPEALLHLHLLKP